MSLHFFEFLAGQTCRLVQNLPADVELANIVQQRRSPDVLDPSLIQAHVSGHSCCIDRDPPGMVFRVRVLGNEMAQDHEYAEIGVPEFD